MFNSLNETLNSKIDRYSPEAKEIINDFKTGVKHPFSQFILRLATIVTLFSLINSIIFVLAIAVAIICFHEKFTQLVKETSELVCNAIAAAPLYILDGLNAIKNAFVTGFQALKNLGTHTSPKSTTTNPIHSPAVVSQTQGPTAPSEYSYAGILSNKERTSPTAPSLNDIDHDATTSGTFAPSAS